MQLNLRHKIRRDILIYPGYVPEPGMKYKVFHYGLRFSVGNWSFDKADWRNTDMVNTCWAKFPEPPDASILYDAVENNRQRDLLSIECGNALNKALYLHHERRKCPPANAITDLNPPVVGERTPSYTLRNKGKDGHMPSLRKIFVPIDVSNSSSLHGSSSEQKSPRVWMIGLWGLSVLGFLVVITMAFSGRKQEGLRIKAHRHKKSRATFSDTNGRSYRIHDKNLYDKEMDSNA